MPIRYYSTNRGVPEVTLDAALLEGQASDRGLYLPDRFPSSLLVALSVLFGEMNYRWTNISHTGLARNNESVVARA